MFVDMIYYQKTDSPIGIIHIIASNSALIAVSLQKNWKKTRVIYSELSKNKNSITEKAVAQLKEYFSGKRTDFDLPIQLVGTDFQRKTWEALSQIPYGKTISYSEQAKAIKNQKAVRAIGRTNGLNPICIILPCHRVIGKSGSLTGYAGGLHVKKYLLNLEANTVTAQHPKRQPGLNI